MNTQKNAKFQLQRFVRFAAVVSYKLQLIIIGYYHGLRNDEHVALHQRPCYYAY